MFIDEYINYAKPLTDAPEDFHFMAAESLLSITVGRRAYIRFSYGKCYLNTYLMVVAPPSARKSTEFGIMKPVLDAIMKNDAMLPLKTTPEQLLNMMSRNSQRLYTSDEYSIFLADAKKKYNDGIISDIVKLYDSPDTYVIVWEHHLYTHL